MKGPGRALDLQNAIQRVGLDHRAQGSTVMGQGPPAQAHQVPVRQAPQKKVAIVSLLISLPGPATSIGTRSTFRPEIR